MKSYWELQTSDTSGIERFITFVNFDLDEWRKFNLLKKRLIEDEEDLADRGISYELGELSVRLSRCVSDTALESFITKHEALQVDWRPPKIVAAESVEEVLVLDIYL